MTDEEPACPPIFHHSGEPGVKKIIDIITSHFDDMDDGDNTPFGMYGEVESAGNVVTVSPDQDSDHYVMDDDGDLIAMLVDGEAPTTPVIRITVERIG